MLWRRALLRTFNNLKTNQEVFVMGGAEYAEGEAPLLESGRWSIKWQDGHRERYTSLTLRVDPVLGMLNITGTFGDLPPVTSALADLGPGPAPVAAATPVVVKKSGSRGCAIC